MGEEELVRRLQDHADQTWEFRITVGRKFSELTVAIESFVNYFDQDAAKKLRLFEQLKSQLEKNRALFSQALDYDTIGVAHALEALARYRDDQNSDTNYLARFGLDLIAELSPRMVEIARDETSNFSANAVRSCLHHLFFYGTAEEKQRYLDMVMADTEFFLREATPNESCLNMDDVFTRGTPAQVEAMHEVIVADLDENIFSLPAIEKICLLFKRPEWEFWRSGDHYINKFLEHYGLGSEVSRYWHISTGGDRMVFDYKENLRRIFQLEEKDPGASVFLFEEYGIADFGRYPLELLQQQYRRRDDTTTPQGLVIYPRDDYSGAFYHDREALGNLVYQVGDKFVLRAAECETVSEVIKMIEKCGNKNKVSLLILGGHGNETSIQFGGGFDAAHTLEVKDLDTPAIERLTTSFTAEPTVILASCSTGKEGGIAQKLSEKLKAKVLGPDRPTGISNFTVGHRPGRPFSFNVSYADDDYRKPTAARSKKVYQQGAVAKKFL